MQTGFQNRLQRLDRAGGAHHTAFSYSVTAEHMQDFANIAGIELVRIGANTNLDALQQNLRNNEVYFHLATGLQLVEAP